MSDSSQFSSSFYKINVLKKKSSVLIDSKAIYNKFHWRFSKIKIFQIFFQVLSVYSDFLLFYWALINILLLNTFCKIFLGKKSFSKRFHIPENHFKFFLRISSIHFHTKLAWRILCITKSRFYNIFQQLCYFVQFFSFFFCFFNCSVNINNYYFFKDYKKQKIFVVVMFSVIYNLLVN